MDREAGPPPVRRSRVATLIVPSVVTGIAFVALERADLLGNLPIVVLIALLAGGGLMTDLLNRFVRRDQSTTVLNAVIAAQILLVTAIIYAIGWGPTLTIGYVIILAGLLEDAGARVWRITLLWTTI